MTRLALFLAPLLATSALAAPPVGPVDIAPVCTPSPGGVPSAGDRQCNADHRVYRPGTPVAGWGDELVVILPGTSMEPDKHDQLARIAAKAGYRTVALAYDNRHERPGGGAGGVSALCNDISPADVNCNEAVLDTILWGPTASPPLAGHTYDDEDAVETRLLGVLDELHAKDMLNGVNDFGYDSYRAEIAAGDWCRILVVGFSQGSSVAAVLASQVDLGGAVMLDGPGGWVDVGGVLTAQSWRTGPHASDGDVLFGAYHTTKSNPPEDSWDDLNIPVGTHLVEESTPATSFLPVGTHRIEVDQAVPAGAPGVCTDHMSMARDDCMPFAGSMPLLAPAYRDMIQAAAAAVDADCAP